MRLPVEAEAREQAIRSALVARWQALPDAGSVHNRERYADDVSDWLRLVSITDAATSRTVVRGATVRLLAFTPDEQESVYCEPVGLVRYALEIFYGFDDAGNSSVGFNALIMRGLWALMSERTFGYSNLRLNTISPIDDARVEMFDKTLVHTTEYELEFEVRN